MLIQTTQNLKMFFGHTTTSSMKRALPIFIVLFLSSCTANWHLKKAIAKKPSILNEGTIIQEVRDTIMLTIEKVQHDTVVAFTTDTIIVQKDRARAVVLIDTVLKEVFVEVTCDPDTVFQEVILEQTILQPKVHDSVWNWKVFKVVGIILLIVVVVLLLLKEFSRVFYE